MIQKATKPKAKWHKPSGREVEVLMSYGQVVRCRVIESGKVTSFHPSSLVDSYAETKPAKVAVWKAKLMASGERITESHRCSCGGRKSSGSIMCHRCRYPNPGQKTAKKVCECGKLMNHKSQRCVECMTNNRDDGGKFNDRVGENAHGIPQPTDEEALFLTDPPEGREHEADAIIAKYTAMIRASRIESGILHQSIPVVEYGRLALYGNACKTFRTLNSDRRRGRA